jgi:ADP-ribose pyrophosphatase
MKSAIKIIEKETLFEGRFIRFVLTRFTDSSGVTREWESIDRVNCRGIVAIVPVTKGGEFVLIRQFRPPVSRFVVEFPAGLNDRGDTLEGAARRELTEETGYSAKEMIFLAEGPLSSGASGEILTVFLAKGIEFAGIENRDETEDIEVLKIPAGKIESVLSELQSEGNYIDLKVYGFIELAKRHLTG